MPCRRQRRFGRPARARHRLWACRYSPTFVFGVDEVIAPQSLHEGGVLNRAMTPVFANIAAVREALVRVRFLAVVHAAPPLIQTDPRMADR